MNDGAKQAYLDKMDAQLREWSATVETVKSKIAKGTADIRISYHNEVEKWQEKESTFKTKMEELRAAGNDGFETLKAGTQHVWNEVNVFIKSLEDKQNEVQKSE